MNSVMRTLDGTWVGKTRGGTGDGDREIVEDAIFASTARGVVPLVFKPIDIQAANGFAWRRSNPLHDFFDEGRKLCANQGRGFVAK